MERRTDNLVASTRALNFGDIFTLVRGFK